MHTVSVPAGMVPKPLLLPHSNQRKCKLLSVFGFVFCSRKQVILSTGTQQQLRRNLLSYTYIQVAGNFFLGAPPLSDAALANCPYDPY